PPLAWTALFEGALHGRRIVLDPEGGGDETAGMGPSGTRAAFYNMDVARALEAYLVAAGAEVRLARTADVAASDVERVRVGGACRGLRAAGRACAGMDDCGLAARFAHGPGRDGGPAGRRAGGARRRARARDRRARSRAIRALGTRPDRSHDHDLEASAPCGS